MENHHSLSLPLLPLPDATISASTSQTESLFRSNYSIAVRFLSVIFIGIISLWANHEASKGFDITVVNDARGSLAGQRFDLFYVSNDEATRMMLNASKFVENVIYPSDADDDYYPKKEVKSVNLKLSRRNLSDTVAVEKSENGSDFFIHLSPSIFTEGNVNLNRDMAAAILRAMARIWLWDGDSDATAPLISGIVEYISVVAGFGKFEYPGEIKSPECDVTWWTDEDPTVVAVFLDQQERRRKGFIQRLNRGLKSRWHDRTVENALMMPAQRPCGLINY